MKACITLFLVVFIPNILNSREIGFHPESSEPDTTQFSSVMVGADYTSNMSSHGRFSEIAKQPSFSGYAAYYSKFGFNAGITSIAIGNSDSSATEYTSEYDFNLGYELKMGKLFTASASYSHFLYSKNSFSINSIYTDECQLGINLLSKWMTANVSGYYLIGDYNEWMGSAQVGSNLQIKDVFFKNHFLTIAPQVMNTLGNQKYYNQYAYQTYWYLYPIAKLYPNITIQDLYAHQAKYPRMWRYLNRHPKVLQQFKTLDKTLIITDLFKAENKFNLSSLNLSIPLYYTMGNFTINLAYSLTIPLNVPEYFDNSVINYYSAGLSYTFDL